MQKTKIIFTQEFYEKYLSTVNNIHFTKREADVIACLLNARGTSKIAFLLSIAQRTVETHIRNIMSKLECNTREGIIDFFEASDKLSLMRQYYVLLQNEILFEKSLANISKINKNKVSICFLAQGQDKDNFIFHLKSHLELTGITTTISAHVKNTDCTIFVFPKTPTDVDISSLLTKLEKSKNKVLVLLQEKKNSREIPKEFMKWDCIDLEKQENYFFSFFLILNTLLPHLSLDKTITEFKAKYKKIQINENISQASLGKEVPQNHSIYQRWGYFVSISVLLIFIGAGALVLFGNQKKREEISLRSDLVIPTETTFLNRPQLITQIDSVFKGSEGIQSVALVGIGGSGKTTLAHQYASQQKSSIIWELNAETNGSLKRSFENLAYNLSSTEEDRKILCSLQELKNSSEQEKRLITLVKNLLRAHSNWFLIYDNVENLTNIQQYFPHDENTWGKGKVILTTRNSNIHNTNSINQAIHIEELSKDEKFNLFTKIMNQGEKWKLQETQKEETLEFLNHLPPFPLDISVAAYYLKVANISYQEYLENIATNHQEFATIQENLLKEAGSYIKTRYGIITLSLEHLIKSHKDFGDLLLFISLLDFQNIPRDLLKKYKSDVIVDNFIYYLKKYSLITNDHLDSNSAYSIHKSTQNISFAYLNDFLKLNKDSKFIKDIVYILDDYLDEIIEQENYSRMQLVAGHIEQFLNHVNLLTNFSTGLLKSKLGCIYYFINDEKSKKMMEDSLKILKMESLESKSSNDNLRMARSLLHIGAVYTELRLDKEAEETLEKARSIYEKKESKNYVDLSWALSHLGNLQRKIGNYEKARDYFEESIYLYKQYGDNNERTARTLAYLGSVYKGLGSYQKSVDILKKSLEYYKKNNCNDHFRVGWILVQLGHVFSKLGNFQKAKEYLEEGLLVFQKILPDNHVSLGLAYAYLGNCHRQLGDYDKSCDYLEQSLKTHQKHFNENHVKMGWVLFHLASTYKVMGQHQRAQELFDKVLKIYANHYGEDNIEKARLLDDMAKIFLEKNLLDDAENFIRKSLKIFQSHNHIEVYSSLITLGEILLKKSNHPSYAKNSQESQSLKDQAIDKFNQALKITEQHFPKNSIHIQKIHTRINSIQRQCLF